MVTIIKTEFIKLKRYFIIWIGVSLMLLTVLLTLFTTMADDGMTWDYAPYPYFEDGVPVTPTGSWSLGINRNSQYKDAAARLIRFLTLNPVCIEWFKMDGHLPSNKTTLEYINSNPEYDEWPNTIFDLLQYESQNTAVARPLSPGYLEYENMLTTAFEDIRNGADIQSTLEQAEVRIDRAISRYL